MKGNKLLEFNILEYSLNPPAKVSNPNDCCWKFNSASKKQMKLKLVYSLHALLLDKYHFLTLLTSLYAWLPFLHLNKHHSPSPLANQIFIRNHFIFLLFKINAKHVTPRCANGKYHHRYPFHLWKFILNRSRNITQLIFLFFLFVHFRLSYPTRQLDCREFKSTKVLY